MPRLTNLWQRVLLPRPQFFFLRSRDGDGDAGGGHCPPGSEANGRDAERHDTDRLERIAKYARAGYFHIHTTLDMMHTVGEIPLE